LSTTTILVDKKPVEIPTQPFTAILHNTPMKIEVPAFFEINSMNTISCIDLLKQDEWNHIRTGGVFQPLFDIVFKDDPMKLPEDVSELKEKDEAIKHVAGMVILMFEHAYIKGEKIFLRLPETYLHPRQTRHLMDLVNQVQMLCGGKPNVITKTVEKPKRKKKAKRKGKQQ